MNVSDPMLVLAKVHLDYDAVKSCDNRHELPSLHPLSSVLRRYDYLLFII